MDKILIKGDTMYLKALDQQTMSDAETPPLTYLSDLACWLANESNKSPTDGKQMK